MVLDHGRDHPSRWAAVASIAEKIGCSAHTLLGWVRPRSMAVGCDYLLDRRGFCLWLFPQPRHYRVVALIPGN